MILAYEPLAAAVRGSRIVLDANRGYRSMLAQPAVLGYKRHPILHQEWKYLDIERKDNQ